MVDEIEDGRAILDAAIELRRPDPYQLNDAYGRICGRFLGCRDWVSGSDSSAVNIASSDSPIAVRRSAAETRSNNL